MSRQAKISVVIPVKNEIKNRSRGYDGYGTVQRIGQIMRVCGHIVGFMDALVASLRKNWFENLVNDFGNDVDANGGMIR